MERFQHGNLRRLVACMCASLLLAAIAFASVPQGTAQAATPCTATIVPGRLPDLAPGARLQLAVVVLQGKTPVANIPVRWVTDGGSVLAAGSVTDGNGRATAVLTAARTAGRYTVWAYVDRCCQDWRYFSVV